jgi:aerobic-type carbon monoxide dehydrogenase small subunit (CoxS/CutS family)
MNREAVMAEAIELLVNGTPRQVTGPAERTLLSVLRDDLELTGCKYGCGEGQCGACTVLVDGKAVRSCITQAGDCRGKPVTTIESLERNGRLHPLQEAFVNEGALQCGYCTCGMIVAALALLQKTPQPTTAEIAHGLQGNICRCGCYARIVTAVQSAAVAMRGGV